MKTKILSILALLLMTVTQGAWAQETLTVYDGTADSQYIPMYGYSFNFYTKSECIIPASELTAMKGGTITAITFYAMSVTGNNSTFGTANQKVFLKEVSETTLSSSYSGTTGATVVFDGTLPMPTTSASGYTITFSQGYTYNGGNLLIGIYNAAKGSWKKVIWYGIDNQSSGVSAFGADYDNLANIKYNALTFLPKTTFTYNPAPTPVDLGLPSGKKWADMNVGASSETGYGTYYAWSSSDIATAQWGNDWRMPTKAEIEELKSYTDHEWATIGGVNGMKFMKKTDHSVYIFLPATGLNSSENVGSVGFYWTSTEESSSHAYFLYASSSTLASYKSLKTDKLPVRPVQMFVGEGTQASPYLIASTTDWNNLVSAVNVGETYNGNYFKMTANVGTVSTWMTGTFSGTFDGDGKTLTVGYSTSARYCAPFGTLGGTVKNLRVAGTVSTSGKNFGGIAAQVTSGKTATIQNCRVSATLTSTLSGDNSSGGFVGVVWNGGTLNITGCAFTGSLTGSGNAFGGFLGYKEETGTCSMTDCLFAPASVTVSTDYAGTFSRPSAPTIDNCYFTRTFGTAQGLQARTIAKGDYVSTLAISGDGTEYDVSGITAYSGGISFNDGSTTTFYGGSGQTVSLALTAETRTGYQFKQYAASQGTLSGQTTDAPTLTMPAANSTANDAVTISAEYDPLYNADFADGNDNDGWDIDPTSGVEGTSVTVSYTGENKVKSVTVAPKGALTGKFSVSSTKQVQFSKGNLQYNGSAWSFHTNQYDCVFTSNSEATDYPMDIFCWGNIDNPAYDGSTGIGTNGVDLSGSSDWGSNTITNGCTGWRTMSKDEWEYLFANHSYGYATVAGQTGVIILPDVFTDPMRNNGSAAFAASTASWTANVYAAGDDWTAMEKAGALFLPAAGGRDGASIKSIGINGSYWSSTAYTSHGRFITFQEGSAPNTTYYSIHGYGKSVRLVKDVE